MKRLIDYFGKMLFIPVYAVIVMTSCQKDELFLEDYVILTLDKVTATTATFTGHCNSTIDFAFLCDFYYSIIEGDPYPHRMTVEYSDLDSSNNFEITITNLKQGTKYYYCMHVYPNFGGKNIVSDTFNFTTEAVSFGELQITPKSLGAAEVYGTIRGLSDEDKESIKIGIIYSDELGKVENGEGENVIISDISATGNFKFLLSDLFAGTKYYYCGYVCQYDNSVSQYNNYVYDAPAEFATLNPCDTPQRLPLSAAMDMSSLEPSNCYVISETGLYKFKTVRGNSDVSVGDVASAAILWETFGTSTTPEFFDLIKAVCYEDGYVAFQTADVFKEGNAVIAAKDAYGNILWSWHIWLTDQPQAHVYNNNAGTMMDRNLGATSATPGDVGALGLLYQWGRKDPFLGSSSISSAIVAKSTITWPSPVSSSSSTGTIDYATANPTTFITYNSSNYDWQYNQDNTRWQSEKTIYDPCPAGWHVPDGGSNGVWKTAGFDNANYDSTNEGISFSISSPATTWYPASGYRHLYVGSLNNVGSNGGYWSASPDSSDACSLYFNYLGRVYPSNSNGRALGYSVRCLQE